MFELDVPQNHQNLLSPVPPEPDGEAEQNVETDDDRTILRGEE